MSVLIAVDTQLSCAQVNTTVSSGRSFALGFDDC